MIKNSLFRTLNIKTLHPRSFCIIYLCFIFFRLDAAPSLKVEVSAKAAILINAETGMILFEKNAYQPLFPASITKMVTAMYALEKKEGLLHESVQVSHDAVATVHPHVRRAVASNHPPYRLEFGGSHMGIKAGEILPLDILLYGLMLVSGNDAANVIAQHISGTIPQFMDELNDYVKSKGCLNTHLFTPHGLPHPDHKTTAYDMAILAKEAIKSPQFLEIVKTVKFTRPSSNRQNETVLYQHNALLKPGGKFYYPKAIGIKTGYTSAGGYTLVAAAKDDRRKLIAVLLGCDQLEQRYRDAISLFEAAFNEKKASRTLFSKEFDVFSHQIKGGKKALSAALGSDLIVDYFASEGQIFHPDITWREACLPIQIGQKVGEVCINSNEGQIVTRAPLFALNDVGCTLSYMLELKWKDCKQFLHWHLSFILGLIGCCILSGTFYIFHRRKEH